jgi:hypothetical protein
VGGLFSTLVVLGARAGKVVDQFSVAANERILS